MFSKRNDRLQRLNDELLAEDEEYYEEEYEEEDPEETDLSEILEEDGEEEETELFYRNHSNNYGTDVRNYANRYGKGRPKVFDEDEYDEDEELDDEEFLYRDDYRRASRQKKKADRANRKENRKKLGLAIIALVELIAIGGIIAWWASWIL